MTEIYRYYESSTQLTQDGEVVIPTTDETARHALRYLLAGGMAGAVSRTCTAPFDRLKIYLITHSSTPTQPLTLFNAVKIIYSQGGWRSFFVGNGLNIMKIIPESAIKFYSYESCKELMANIFHCEDKDSIPTGARFAAGGMAGICAQFSIYPVETLKTRIMTRQANGHGSPAISSSSSSPTSHNHQQQRQQSSATATATATNSKPIGNRLQSSIVAETAKSMYAKGGVRAFWPGLVSFNEWYVYWFYIFIKRVCRHWV